MGPGPALVHASYSLDEIPTAFGEMTLEHPDRIREGVRFNKDYAVSPELFHWESQSMTSQASPTGQRYIHHLERGSNILLFVRRTGKLGTGTAPYIFLGSADHVSHERERPSPSWSSSSTLTSC